MTIWRMCIACWISKAANTDSEHVILPAFHCNSGCTNVPQCYVLCTLSCLLTISDLYVASVCNKPHLHLFFCNKPHLRLFFHITFLYQLLGDTFMPS